MLPARTSAPCDLKGGSRNDRASKCLDKRLGHVGAGDPVSGRESVGFLTQFKSPSPARTVEEESDSNDRIVDTARPESSSARLRQRSVFPLTRFSTAALSEGLVTPIDVM